MKVLLVSAMLMAFSVSTFAKGQEKNHNLNWGLISGKTNFQDTNEPGDKDNYKFTGFGGEYQYRPVDSINVFTHLEFGSGKLKDEESGETYSTSHADLEIDLGYRFKAHEMVTITPFIGRTGYATIVDVNNGVTKDLKTSYAATNLGALFEAKPTKGFTLGFKPMIQLTDSVKQEISVSAFGISKTVEQELKNNAFWRFDVPVTYNINEKLGIHGIFTYQTRKLESKDGEDIHHNFDNVQVRLGLSHLF